MNSRVYVNRTLNLKRIRYIGLDMDHTLIRYKVEEFEALSHTIIKEKLVKNKNYPSLLLDLPFDYRLAIRGLVIDRQMGNILKLNRHSAIRTSHHGSTPIDFKTQQKLYKSIYIDLSDKNYLAVDTAFSISLATLFSQVVDLKEHHPHLMLPDYARLADDVLYALDEGHRDGSIKETVKKDLDKYIIKEADLVAGLEKFKKHGKKIFIVTNSDFFYTKLLLDYAINPFLKEHNSWLDLFEIVVTNGQKPRFFYDDLRYLRVNPVDGTMSNVNDKLTQGVYQGGSAQVFTKDLELEGDEILYIGDHIYGDILRLKKDCGWRTAMVIEELTDELKGNREAEPINQEIEILMKKKEPLEDEFTQLMTGRSEGIPSDSSSQSLEILHKKIIEIDSHISVLIRKQQMIYNENWGQMMRAGNEESYFAHQVDRYACVYMAKLSDLFELSPRTYFRAPRRSLAHEII